MHAVETTHPLIRVDAWSVSSAHCQAHYQIVAEAEPDVLCRRCGPPIPWGLRHGWRQLSKGLQHTLGGRYSEAG